MNNTVLFTHNDKEYTVADVANAIEKIGIKKGDTIFIHSQLKYLGKINSKISREQFTKGFVSAFLQVIGKDGNLIMPTFSYSFCGKDYYDPDKTPSTVGILTETFRKLSGVKRSIDPIFSVAAYGPDSDYFTDVGTECLGKNSIFEKLYKKNAKILFIGERFDITYMHYVERNCGISYRYDKKFSGTIKVGEVEKPYTFTYYVRDLDIDPRYALENIAQYFEEKGILHTVHLGYSKLRMVSAVDAYKAIEGGLKENEALLLEKPLPKKQEKEINKLQTDSKTTTGCDVTQYDNHIGRKLYELLENLYPICRSITGDGVRQTLKKFQEFVPLEIYEVPCNSKAFDWTVPKEWNIKDAWIKDPNGNKVVDFKKNNLHVLIYSTPIHKKMTLKELKSHIYTLPDKPTWIPYIISYYKERWGFCMAHEQLEQLQDGDYEVMVDSSLTDGSLSYGEYVIKGELDDEVLFSTYICHPSLANDNLSGPVLQTLLAKHLTGKKLKYTYRFIFIPETIGSIVWLSKNEDNLHNIKHGLVVTCVADSGKSTYKKSRIGNAFIDRAAEKVLQDSGTPYIISDYWPQGSDERQFCSPGFNLPIGSLMRTPYGRYPEYHTSADNLSFVKPEYFQDTFDKYVKIIDILENDETYINTIPKCEPQLGKHDLYGSLGGQNQLIKRQEAQAWVLNLCDGGHSLLDIAYRSKLPFDLIRDVVPPLLEKGLLKKK